MSGQSQQTPTHCSIPRASRDPGTDQPHPGDLGEIDPGCSAPVPARELLTGDWLPLRRQGTELVVASAGTLTGEQVRAGVARWYGESGVLIVPADRATIQDTVLRLRDRQVAELMSDEFSQRFPEFAARSGPAWWQRVAGVVTAIAVVTALILGWTTWVMAAVALVAAAGLLFRSVLAAGPATTRTGPSVAPDVPDADLPSYTVLVAAYQEQYVIADTLRSICAADYPKDRVEVLVLLEKRDVETIAAVREAGLPPWVRVVLLPAGKPQTKPRAANLGLLLARGELLVIFDADDRPEPDQLRRVAGQFAHGGDRLAVVQARLNFYNRGQTLLTRLFSMEYSFQWDLMYAGLSRWRLPLPLGGTSNHARTDVLRRAGGWDAWNVTEDADLGVRLAAMGYQVAMSDSVTWEEAAAQPWPWIRQRTRWLKGHLMTLAVHTRQPIRAVRRFGVAGMVGLVGVVGGSPIVAMLLPLPLLGLLVPDRGIDVGGHEFAVLGSATLVWAVAIGIYLLGYLRAGARAQGLGWAMRSLLLPYFWLLACVAGWRALGQLIRAPFEWEKTAHGSPATGTDTATAARAELSQLSQLG